MQVQVAALLSMGRSPITIVFPVPAMSGEGVQGKGYALPVRLDSLRFYFFCIYLF